MSERPGWDSYFLGIAQAVAARADCTRRKVGAVIVTRDRRIASTGYNGVPSGMPGCLEGACPRGRLGYDARAAHGSYDDCLSCHGEINAILYSDRGEREGATLYCTDEPCFTCWKIIAMSGIERVVTPNGSVEVLRRMQPVYEGRAPQP